MGHLDRVLRIKPCSCSEWLRQLLRAKVVQVWIWPGAQADRLFAGGFPGSCQYAMRRSFQICCADAEVFAKASELRHVWGNQQDSVLLFWRPVSLPPVA